jgi:hypothetical protein
MATQNRRAKTLEYGITSTTVPVLAPDLTERAQRRRRQGSERRRRTEQCNFRLLPAERRELEDAAADAGVTFGNYVRDAALAAARRQAAR